MVFLVQNSGIAVVDELRGITVKMAFGRFDDTDEVPYEYTEQPPNEARNPHKVESLTFVFQTVAEQRKLDDYVYDGQNWPHLETVGIHIVEDSLIRGLFEALGPSALDKVDLTHIKVVIKEAMYEIGVPGQSSTDSLSEFRVDFC